MLQEIIAIGDKIDIRVLGKNGKPVPIGRTYVSQLIDIVDQNVLHIAAPMALGKTFPLQVGESYELCFYTERGLYRCNCQAVINRRDQNTISTEVRITSNLEKFQRRQYYRLECVNEFEYRNMTLEEQLLKKKQEELGDRDIERREKVGSRLKKLDVGWRKGYMTDISGGGAKFSSEEQLQSGDRLQMKLSFIDQPGPGIMTLGGRIVASERNLNRTGVYEHRVQFDDISHREREALIRYIFEQERWRMKNEKG